MFPNVRLLIVAVLASIVALSCGFGVFAAFRVNHDPLSRLPPVIAPLQLVADNAAPTTVTIAPGTPFGSRLRFGEAQIGSAAADAPAQRASDASATQVAPEAAASAPAPAGAMETEASDAGQDAKSGAIAASALGQAPAREVQAAHDTDESEAADKASQPASAAVPDVAAIEPAMDQAQPAVQPAEQANAAAESATTSEAKAFARAVAKTRRKTVRSAGKRQRVAAKAHRARKRRASAVAQVNDENPMSQQPVFQSVPEAFDRQPLESRRTTGRTAKDTAVGGPFVGLQGQ